MKIEMSSLPDLSEVFSEVPEKIEGSSVHPQRSLRGDREQRLLDNMQVELRIIAGRANLTAARVLSLSRGEVIEILAESNSEAVAVLGHEEIAQGKISKTEAGLKFSVSKLIDRETFVKHSSLGGEDTNESDVIDSKLGLEKK